jgi:hypothetical protein
VKGFKDTTRTKYASGGYVGSDKPVKKASGGAAGRMTAREAEALRASMARAERAQGMQAREEARLMRENPPPRNHPSTRGYAETTADARASKAAQARSNRSARAEAHFENALAQGLRRRSQSSTRNPR